VTADEATADEAVDAAIPDDRAAFGWIAAIDFLSATVVWEAATDAVCALTPDLALLVASLVTAIDAGVSAS
jgi:hypothetical protein